MNSCTAHQHKEGCIHFWHRMFGHRDPVAIRKMCSSNLVDGMKIVECGMQTQCETCLEAKSTRLPFPKHSLSTSDKVLDLIHSDVCGPMQTESIGKKRYFLSLIDDYSKYTVIYFLRNKSEVEVKIKEYIAMVENEFGKKPKVIRSDRGGEYIGIGIKSYLSENGIKTQFTAPYSPQQNGVAERKNRTLVEMARCLLTDAELPKYLWAEAVNTANYIQNRTITKGADSIPCELWNNKKPNANHFEIFGTKCYVHTPTEKRRKLDNTATQMCFIGYEDCSKAYRLYDPVHHKLVVSRDVRFVYNNSHSSDVSIELSEKKKAKHSVQIGNESEIDSDLEISDDFESADSSYKESSEGENNTTLTGDFNDYRDNQSYSSDETNSTDGDDNSTDSDVTVVQQASCQHAKRNSSHYQMHVGQHHGFDDCYSI